jgi:hypothetical protein
MKVKTHLDEEEEQLKLEQRLIQQMIPINA